MSESELEEKVKNLEERLAFLEDYIMNLEPSEPLTDEELKRIKESDKWIKSGDTSKLIRIK